jgi:alkanesulfonate monooxygenase SsuD/methylene tetrahydromethanopterin reductase-like flavin-dependent oxidoreductase (luciferase family)
MNLGFFTMPIHPLDKDWRQSLREDREAFVLADELGFTEGYVGEHTTDRAENITSGISFLCWIANDIKRMRLGTGTINMPNTHPATVAAQIAMLDHMLDGRLNFGISPGGLMSDAEVFGNLDADRTAMFREAIDLVLKIWTSEPPYDLTGQFWTLSTARTMMTEIGQGYIARPLQQPHPPVVVTAVSPYSQSVSEAAARGWEVISANFLLPKWVATHWTMYVGGCARGGRQPNPANWRVAKSIFVADDLKQAEAYALGPQSPYRYYYKSLLTKLLKGGRGNQFKENAMIPDSAVTLDGVLDDLVIWGTPDKVADEIAAFRQTIGDFGTLLYAGKDWADPALARRSMVLLKEQVLPKL